MPRGDKSSYTDKQKRKAQHIEEGYESIAASARTKPSGEHWATVNKETGGGNKSGSGRGVKDTNVSLRRKAAALAVPRGGKAAARRPAAARSQFSQEGCGDPQTSCSCAVQIREENARHARPGAKR